MSQNQPLQQIATTDLWLDPLTLGFVPGNKSPALQVSTPGHSVPIITNNRDAAKTPSSECNPCPTRHEEAIEMGGGSTNMGEREISVSPETATAPPAIIEGGERTTIANDDSFDSADQVTWPEPLTSPQRQPATPSQSLAAPNINTEGSKVDPETPATKGHFSGADPQWSQETAASIQRHSPQIITRPSPNTPPSQNAADERTTTQSESAAYGGTPAKTPQNSQPDLDEPASIWDIPDDVATPQMSPDTPAGQPGC
ncbi:hypothetical protein PoB_005776400 [Plakobranchus ocellatus]|uniref:Uncharacterized protein n=1 Tax=Plakobranchus ocellatus TaxID=259542 RepID=A0AAV4CK35_9GAST|nr:hypothetical protein PoB_005776400 [Plakobranchus ocellatus]